MGLMLARIGNSFTSPAARIGTGLVLGTAATTGLALVGQYAKGDDFAKPSGIPTPISWEGGTWALSGAAAILTGSHLTTANGYGRAAWPGGFTLAGAGAGVLLGAFLVAPALRRAMAEGQVG